MKKKYYPGIAHSFLLFAVCIGLQIIAGTVAGVLLHLNTDSVDLSTVTLVLSPICTAVTAAIGIIISKTSVKDYYAPPASDKSSIFLSVFCCIGAYFVIVCIGSLLESFIPSNDSISEVFVDGFNNWFGIISLVVLAPVFEETLFRGVILRGYLKNYSIAKSIIISSLLFGLFHLNPLQSITATLLGVLLSWVFVKTGSILVTILLHAIYNGMTVILYHLSLKFGDNMNITLMVIMLAAIILGGLSLFLLIRKPNCISHILAEREAEPEVQKYLVLPDQPINTAQYDQLHDSDVFQIQPNIQTFPQPMKHPKTGIVSFVISIVTGMVELIFLGTVVTFAFISTEAAENAATVYVVVSIIGTLANLAGICLGIGGIRNKNSKKAFSVLEIVLNSVIALLFILIFLRSL